jgi:hypothetical protein
MTQERRSLALRAARRAYELRRLADIPLDGALCVYDLAQGKGVEVRFADLPSMEGIYYPARATIVLSSLRPAGRQSFTCGHELGHHVYGHGEQFDELVEDRGTNRRQDPHEYEADCFAGALLMPKMAVLKGLSERRLRPTSLLPEDVYRIANWLGVGYTALITHMGAVLRIISPSQVTALSKVRLPAIRKSVLGTHCSEHLIVADEAWSSRPIDAHVPDIIVLPANAEVEGSALEVIHRDSSRCVARAARPGIGRVYIPGGDWAQFTRVSRQGFIGLARFMYLEEVDDV